MSAAGRWFGTYLGRWLGDVAQAVVDYVRGLKFWVRARRRQAEVESAPRELVSLGQVRSVVTVGMKRQSLVEGSPRTVETVAEAPTRAAKAPPKKAAKKAAAPKTGAATTTKKTSTRSTGRKKKVEK